MNNTASFYTAYQPVGGLVSYQQFATGICCTASNGFVTIEVVRPAVLRITTAQQQQQAPLSYAVVAQPEQTQFDVQDQAQAVQLTTDSLKVLVNKATMAVAIYTQSGQPLNADDQALSTGWLGQHGTVYKTLVPDERFIGLGEKTGHLNRRGHAFTHWNTDFYAATDNDDPLYCSTPFYMGVHSNGCYGVFFDNCGKTHINFGASNNRFSSLTAEDGQVNYYFFGQQSLPGIINDYTWLTGSMPLPPLWSLGFQQCRYSYHNQQEVLSVAENFRFRNVPADVIYLDIHYMDQFKVFTFNRERFPDPASMIAKLRQMGFRVVVSLDPGIKVEPGYSAFDSGSQADVFVKYPDGTPYAGEVWPGLCHFPDFSNPKTRQWWGNHLQAYTDVGVSGFWNDMNEPATWGNDFPDLVGFSFEGHGATARHGRNVYGLLMARSSYEGARKHRPNERAFCLSRAAFSGSQRYTAVWTGDNVATDRNMFLSIRMVNSLGLAGIAYSGYDIGGFSKETSSALFARWLSIGAFSPLCRAHTNVATRTAEPWAFGETILEISRNYLNVRYQLLPYIYSLFYEAASTGMPVARALPLAYPHDNTVYETAYEHQYLFGPSLLVIPVNSEQQYAQAYLPNHAWYNFYNGQSHHGLQKVLCKAPLAELPVFVKAGAIIPMQGKAASTTHSAGSTLFIHVWYGLNENHFVYYEDDGTTMDYQQSQYLKRTITFAPEQNHIILGQAEGHYTSKFTEIGLVLHGFGKLITVTANDQQLPVETELFHLMEPVTAFDPTAGDYEFAGAKVQRVTLPNSHDHTIIHWHTPEPTDQGAYPEFIH